MNAYWIDAGQVQRDYDPETGYYEPEQACGVYFAKTRGKAKVKFLEEWSMVGMFDYTSPMRIRLLAKHMDSRGRTEVDLLNRFSLWTIVDDIVKKEGYFNV